MQLNFLFSRNRSNFDTVSESPLVEEDDHYFGSRLHTDIAPIPVSDGQEMAGKRKIQILYVFGFISIAIGLASLVCAILDMFSDSDSSQSEWSSPIEARSQFAMLALILAGSASIKASSTSHHPSYQIIICVLAFSLLGAAGCLCDFLMQLLSHQYGRDAFIPRLMDGTSLVFSSMGLLATLVLICISLCISANQREYQQNEPVWWGLLSPLTLGLMQICLGMVASGLTLAQFSALQHEVLSYLLQQVKWTLSSDLIAHGWLITAAGVSSAFVSAHTTRSRQFSNLALQLAVLVTTVRNQVHPLATLYVIGGWSSRQGKLALALSFDYALVTIICVITLLSLIKTIDRHLSISASIRNYIQKRGWNLYRRTCLIQLALASFYFIVWTTRFGEKYLNLMDFTPLPILIFIHASFAYSMSTNYSLPILLINTAWVILCGIYAIRDLYSFDYHTAITDQFWDQKNATTINYGSPQISKGWLHLLTTAVGMMELVLVLVLVLMYIQTLGDTLVSTTTHLQHKKTLKLLLFNGIFQMCSGFLLCGFGFILFLSNQFTMEYLGDCCIFLGILLSITGLFSFLAAHRNSSPVITMPLATVLNVITFITLWQNTDTEGLLISRVMFETEIHPDHREYIVSTGTLAISILCQLSSGLALIAVAYIFGNGGLKLRARTVVQEDSANYYAMNGMGVCERPIAV